ncbi:hypothetical protein MFLAVUS_011097 [Mucor flavus]|uniref:Uncharacterized protein n=1 Tax=Mucor flavus TaxID=439312 RepID=A0ABP9ZEK2_9FUNG
MRVKSWGDKDFESDNEDDVRIDNFTENLSDIFEKDKNDWSEDDIFLLKAVSDYVRLIVDDVIEELNLDVGITSAFYYILTVPSHWEDEMREVLLRPIFAEAGLISSDDHKDRILFCSELDSLCYYITRADENTDYLGKGKSMILCRFNTPEERRISIKLDLISTVNSIFDFPGALIHPKAVRSNTVSLTINDITDGIKAFINTELSTDIQDEIVQTIMNIPFSESFSDKDENEIINFMKPLFTDTTNWKLEKQQEDLIKSISLFNICSKISETILNDIKHVFLGSITNKYRVVMINDEHSSNTLSDKNLLNWSRYILAYSEISTRNKNAINAVSWFTENEKEGSCLYGYNAIQKADIYSKPRIISTQDPTTSSSIFIKSKPDAIMNIDISLESTLLSFSLLDENGFIKEIWDHDYFVTNTRFIMFAQEYLMGDSNIFAGGKDTVLSNDIMVGLQAILNVESRAKDSLISTERQVYIKAFVLIYMIHIKNIVSSKLAVILGRNIDIRIGYAITIEKMLLNGLFGTEEDLKDIIYTSGLLQKDDSLKKLRVITQGERLFPIIQQSLKLQFPLKSYFVVAQLHDYYVQLTLNQVVTESGEGDQEAIIIRDEIIQIPNIYESLCLNMWSNIIEENSLIQLCDRHTKHKDTKLQEIFSSKNRKEFTKNFKRYISENVLNNNSIPQYTDRNTVELSTSCRCKAILTVNDIVDISFKPFLHEMISLVSTSLLFGKYTDIQYIFHLICFNYNPQFQPILMEILKNKSSQLMYEQRADTPHYVIPKLPDQLLRHALEQRQFLYKGFQVGILHHVHSEDYGFGFSSGLKKFNYTYKNNKSDTETTLFDNSAVFYVNIENFDKIIAVYPSELNYDNITQYFKLKNTDNLTSEKTLCIKDTLEGTEGGYFRQGYWKNGQFLPIVISMVYKGYSYSLSLVTKYIGEEIKKEGSAIFAEPMTLARF